MSDISTFFYYIWLCVFVLNHGLVETFVHLIIYISVFILKLLRLISLFNFNLPVFQPYTRAGCYSFFKLLRWVDPMFDAICYLYKINKVSEMIFLHNLTIVVNIDTH